MLTLFMLKLNINKICGINKYYFCLWINVFLLIFVRIVILVTKVSFTTWIQLISCFYPYVIAPNCHQNISRKKFVFGIPVLIPVSRFHKLKIPKYRIKILTGIVSPRQYAEETANKWFVTSVLPCARSGAVSSTRVTLLRYGSRGRCGPALTLRPTERRL
jgi:hypothetical protein